MTKNVVFIGHFAPKASILDQGGSVAGSQVQRQIMEEMPESFVGYSVHCFSMEPQPCWPKGRLFGGGVREDGVIYLPYLNIPVIKHFSFSFLFFLRSILLKKSVFIQYNSYFFENFFVLLLRLLVSAKAAIFIQDIHVSNGLNAFSRKWFRSLSERLSLKLASGFDLIVPVSQAIVEDFQFDRKKVKIFQGGLTRFARSLMGSSGGRNVEDYAVFAGALEPHNGADKLVKQWVSQGIEYPLHVFGRGSLESVVESEAKSCPFVVFHGLVPESEVGKWQTKARWNFCLRYSVGLDERYFFPSKFFNVLASPGAVVVNDFYGLPQELKEYLCIVDGDLSNLKLAIKQGVEQSRSSVVKSRHDLLCLRFSWLSCLRSIASRFCVSAR